MNILRFYFLIFKGIPAKPTANHRSARDGSSAHLRGTDYMGGGSVMLGAIRTMRRRARLRLQATRSGGAADYLGLARLVCYR